MITKAYENNFVLPNAPLNNDFLMLKGNTLASASQYLKLTSR